MSSQLSTVERVAALHRVDLFTSVPGRVLAAVAQAATEVRASPGTLLIEEGAIEEHLLAIVQGLVRVPACTRAVDRRRSGSPPRHDG